MPRSIRHSVATRADLKGIRYYLAEADAEAAADRLLRHMADILAKLKDVPEMGPRRPELGADLRSFPVGKYMLFYTFDNHAVRLVRVLHSARDITTDFFD